MDQTAIQQSVSQNTSTENSLNLTEIFPVLSSDIFKESECVHMSYSLLLPQMVSGNDNETLGLCGLVAAGTSSTQTGIAN